MSNTLAPTCRGCGCTESSSWLHVIGETKKGHKEGDGVFAWTLMCADCQVSRADDISAFIAGLAPGYDIFHDKAA